MSSNVHDVFTYDDILLIPQKSEVSSRSDVSLATEIGYLKLQTPIVSSPMDTVTGVDMAISMSLAGGLGVLHRYNTIEDQCTMASKVLSSCDNVAAAVGISGDFTQRLRALKNAGVYVFCLDVAHGHHIMMERALKSTRDSFGEEVILIAGNIATAEGYSDLAKWGADIVRVGIGGGSICSTRVQTGHGLPTLYSVAICSAQKKLERSRALIMADGGLKSSGDIVKSLAFGADLCMLGSMLAGTPESPGEEIVSLSGVRAKTYRGMASKEAQTDWRGKARSLEGISSAIPVKESVSKIIDELSFNIKSGLSYTGSTNIKDFQERVKYVVQTNASQVESSTHILNRSVVI